MINSYFSVKSISEFKWLKKVAIGLVIIWLLSIVFTLVAWLSIIKVNLGLASFSFAVVRPVAEFFSVLSLKKLPLFEFWRENILLGQETVLLVTEAKNQPDPLTWLMTNYHLANFFIHSEEMLAQGEKTWLVNQVFSKNGYELIELKELIGLLKIINQEKEAGKKYLLIFQNSAELRATGGFMGSYAVLNFAQPDFLRFVIRDIYDPSGLSPTKQSPPGHDFYLSEGQGLPLHDANWSADFPTTAKDILWFFANIDGDPQYYDGVVALNFATLEKTIALLGEIYLPDKKTAVSADELAELLRADRNEFFPGSNQKENNLSALQTALFLKINSLSNQELIVFLKDFLKGAFWREIQFFAVDDLAENSFSKFKLAGDLYAYQPGEVFIFPVESNVGINKANRWVTRTLALSKNNQLLRLQINFNNQATATDRPVLPVNNEFYKTASHLGYINYYRLITSTNLELVSVEVGDQVLTDWDKTELVTTNGQVYYQYGFLVTVPENSQVEVVTDFVMATAVDQVFIQKQSGLIYQNIINDSFVWTEELE